MKDEIRRLQVGGNTRLGSPQLAEGEAPQFPPAVVEELLGDMPSQISVGSTTINLEPETGMSIKDFLLETKKRARKGERLFLITWMGGKTPQRAMIGDHEITYAQSGQVMSGKKEIGNYDRLLTNGGPDGKEQCILVTVKWEK